MQNGKRLLCLDAVFRALTAVNPLQRRTAFGKRVKKGAKRVKKARHKIARFQDLTAAWRFAVVPHAAAPLQSRLLQLQFARTVFAQRLVRS